ncbi:MAG: CHAP domain-containing protein [Sandaracinaceae bacterium]|nr:CHAP domain-containing protein [Sandaracinaceae bacterium]
MRRVLPALAASMLALSLVPSAHADGERERPWPDEWPIELPPIEGPLPPAPPPGPRVEPATASARQVVETLEAVRQNLRETRYQHYRVVRERTGTYFWDCSLMAYWVLDRAAPRSVRHLQRVQRPLAEHFVRSIERAPTDRFRNGWQRIEHIEQLRPGDVFAWRRPRGFPSRNTGHVGFVVGAPRPVPRMPGAYAVRVADSTGSGHQNDTRPYPGHGGFGLGTLVFLTDGQGHGTHYGWYGTQSGGYVVTPILFGRVGT